MILLDFVSFLVSRICLMSLNEQISTAWWYISWNDSGLFNLSVAFKGTVAFLYIIASDKLVENTPENRIFCYLLTTCNIFFIILCGKHSWILKKNWREVSRPRFIFFETRYFIFMCKLLIIINAVRNCFIDALSKPWQR